MIFIIADHSIKKLAILIGKNKPPVPAGGTSLAVNGMIGVALLQLSFRVSKKSWEQKLQNRFTDYPHKFDDSLEYFDDTIKDDIKAFKTNQKHNFENREELKEIIDIPLNAAIKAREMLTLSDNFRNHIKETVKADFAVGRLNLKTCIKGAIEIISSNYQFFDPNDNYIIKTKKEVENISDFIK